MTVGGDSGWAVDRPCHVVAAGEQVYQRGYSQVVVRVKRAIRKTAAREEDTSTDAGARSATRRLGRKLLSLFVVIAVESNTHGLRIGSVSIARVARNHAKAGRKGFDVVGLHEVVDPSLVQDVRKGSILKLVLDSQRTQRDVFTIKLGDQ